MNKVLPQQPKQLEMPLFVDLNGKNQPNHNYVSDSGRHVSPKRDTASLVASPDDLTIYRAISDSFFRQFK